MQFLQKNIQTKNQIDRSLKESRNINLAVAFWGQGASESINKVKNKDIRIICNLESGATNPYEIIKIGEMIGFNNIRSIKNLHAKVYLTDKRMILGSSNFSANGLSLEGNETNKLIEANLLIEDSKIVKAAISWFDSLWRSAKKVDANYCKKYISKWASNRRRNPNQKIETDFFKAFEKGEYSQEKIYIVIDTIGFTKEEEKIANDEAKKAVKGDLFYGGKKLSYWWGYYAIPRKAKILNFFYGKRGGLFYTGIWETLPPKYDRKGFQFCYKTIIDSLSKKQIDQIKFILKKNINKVRFVDDSAEMRLSEFYKKFKLNERD